MTSSTSQKSRLAAAFDAIRRWVAQRMPSDPPLQ